MNQQIAAIIPVKAHSQRVPGKNVRVLGGRPLFTYMLSHAQAAGCFDAIYVDTDSEEVASWARQHGLYVIAREPWLASDEANGNDLLVHALRVCPTYDIYVQLFVTAPFLSPQRIRTCVERLKSSTEYDSVFTVTTASGWYWRDGLPVNYRPGILPRSQDVRNFYKETTGLYAIRATALRRYQCRIGRAPSMEVVDPIEAIDLDTERDLRYAQWLIQEDPSLAALPEPVVV